MALLQLIPVRSCRRLRSIHRGRTLYFSPLAVRWPIRSESFVAVAGDWADHTIAS